MTVADRFARLISWLEPTANEIAAYDTHEATIRSRVTAYKLVRFGSHARDTGVRGSSDRDLMVGLATAAVAWGNGWKSSSTVLENLRVDLDARLPSAVMRSDCAVVVTFSDGKRVDLVPAVFQGMLPVAGTSRPVYQIPDGAGGWRVSAPEAHAAYIEAANARSGSRLRNVARLVKYMRETRASPLPLSSFHVELVLAELAPQLVARSYAQCVHLLLETLVARSCRGLTDPLHLGPPIQAAGTDAKRASLLASLREAANQAAQALYSEDNRDSADAYRRWDIVFNGQFPKANG